MHTLVPFDVDGEKSFTFYHKFTREFCLQILECLLHFNFFLLWASCSEHFVKWNFFNYKKKKFVWHFFIIKDWQFLLDYKWLLEKCLWKIQFFLSLMKTVMYPNKVSMMRSVSIWETNFQQHYHNAINVKHENFRLLLLCVAFALSLSHPIQSIAR